MLRILGSQSRATRSLNFLSFQLRLSSSGTNTVEGPLSNIRILDLTRILAGPFATMILGDLGAEIIKIEKPISGDDTRFWGPPFIGEESSYFLSTNRNKKSVTIDFKKSEGISLLKEMAIKSDVLIENFVPGTLDKLGLGYKDLKSIAPQLIYCSLTGYGSDGPYAHKPGYDLIAASIAGLLSITGPKDGEPCKVGVAMTDLATGLYLHGAVMAALLQRQETNKGQKIDCNLVSTQLSCLTHLASNYLNAGIVAQRWGTAHESIVPYQAFKTKDGSYLTIGATNMKQFEALCCVLHRKDLIESELYKTNALRVANRVSLIQELSNCFETKTSKEWLGLIDSNAFTYCKINTIEEAFEDSQVVHSKIVQEVSHLTEGTVKVVGPAVTYSESINKVRTAAPTLGQHTGEVLKEVLDISDNQLKKLEDAGVITVQKPN